MRRPLFVVCLCLVVIAGMMVRETDWSGLDGRSCIVTGQVYQKDNEYFYLNSIHSINLEQQAAASQQTIPFTENLICEYNMDTEVRLGSIVQVSGNFEAFSAATNPGEFHQAQYYHSLQIGGKLRDIDILEASEEYSQLQELLFRIRMYFGERLHQIFPEKEASIMNAMLLGDKTELNKEIKALYQNNGIIHILSISGLHITIIGMSIYRMLRRTRVPVWVAAICGGGILLLYGVMTGMSVSACRAIGMYLLRMLAEVVGRTYDMLTALGVMAVVIVWSNMGCLLNAGFYLSFGAVLGIGVLYPALQQEQKVPEVLKYEQRHWKQIIRKINIAIGSGLKQSILSGLSVTLMTLPVQLWFYYEVPTYSVLLNLLVIPFMSAVMICGMLAMLVPGLGVLGTVDCLILGGYEWLCNCCEKFPFHKWNPGRPEVWQIAIYYMLLLGVVSGKRLWKSRIQYILLTVSVMLFALPIFSKTTITFLDVGQGDCICVQLESGEVYLFDCGSTSRSQVGEYVLKPFLKYYGINYIDAVFVSHSDADHYNGIQEILQNGEEWGITVAQLVLPDLEEKIWYEEFGELIQMAKEIEISTITAGQGWRVGEAQFLCVHPPKHCALQESNVYSQCFYAEFAQDVSILLTGDVEAEGEDLLLEELGKRGIEDITVLKVAHHGSRYSTGEAFLEQIRPDVAVISYGANNRYGHPHAETLERLWEKGTQILSTQEYGAIRMEREKEVKIYGFKQSKEQ